VWLRRVDSRHHRLAFTNTVIISNNFTVINNRIVNHGPSVDFVARVTRTTIRPVMVETRVVGRPGPNFRGVTVSPGKLVVERPRVRVIAPVRPPLAPPVPPPPGVKVMVRTHPGPTVVRESRSGIKLNQSKKGSMQKTQRVQKSENLRPAARQDDNQKVYRERRSRGTAVPRK
jgi:hypothetical protein